VWLKYVPGISFRTDNGPFKAAMQAFVEKVVSMMKAEGLFEWEGGPIILAQVENEYGPMESVMGAGAKPYAAWAAKMAVATGAGVPWVMCKQDDAPDPVVSTPATTLRFGLTTPLDLLAVRGSVRPVGRRGINYRRGGLTRRRRGYGTR